MKRLLAAGAVLALCSCLDFDGPMAACLDGGACVPDGGTGGGGGGGTGGGAGGGTGGGGGGFSDGGACFGRNGWCWENPLPHALGINALWCGAALPDGGTEVWAAGEGGMLMQWDGQRWLSHADALAAALPPEGTAIYEAPILTGLWFSTSNLYLVGLYTWPVRRPLSGGGFVADDVTVQPFTSLHGQSDTEIYATADDKLLWKTTTGWEQKDQFPNDALDSVVSPAPGQCWFSRHVGNDEWRMHSCTGADQVVIPPGSGFDGFRGSWTSPLGDTFMTGDQGQLWQLDAGSSNWFRRDAGHNGLDLAAGVTVEDGGIHYVVGQSNYIYRLSATASLSEDVYAQMIPGSSAGRLWAVCGRSSTDLWAAGDEGELFHRGIGGVWTGRQKGFADDLLDLSIEGQKLVAVGRNGRRADRQAAGNWVSSAPFVTSSEIRGVWFDDAGFGVAAELNWVEELGTSSKKVFFDAGSGVEVQFNSVWGTSAGDVWAVGTSGATLHRGADGGWQRLVLDGGPLLWSVSGLPTGERWAVGGGGAVYTAETDGGWKLDAVINNGSSVFDVFALDPQHVYAAASGGHLFTRSGPGAWDPVSGLPDLRLSRFTLDNPDFYSLSGTGPSDVWAAGDHGFVVHWDGAGWAHEEVGLGIDENKTTFKLEAIRATATDLWLVGEHGTILHKRR